MFGQPLLAAGQSRAFSHPSLTMDEKVAHACAGNGRAFRHITTLSIAMNRLAASPLTLTQWATLGGAALILHFMLPLPEGSMALVTGLILFLWYRSEAHLKQDIKNIVNEATQESNYHQIAVEYTTKEIVLLRERQDQLTLHKSKEKQQVAFERQRAELALQEAMAQMGIHTMPSLLDKEIAAQTCKDARFSPIKNLRGAMERIIAPSLTGLQWMAIGSMAVGFEWVTTIPVGVIVMGLGNLLITYNRSEAKIKQDLINIINEANAKKEHDHPSESIETLLVQLNNLHQSITTLCSPTAKKPRSAKHTKKAPIQAPHTSEQEKSAAYFPKEEGKGKKYSKFTFWKDKK